MQCLYIGRATRSKTSLRKQKQRGAVISVASGQCSVCTWDGNQVENLAAETETERTVVSILLSCNSTTCTRCSPIIPDFQTLLRPVHANQNAAELETAARCMPEAAQFSAFEHLPHNSINLHCLVYWPVMRCSGLQKGSRVCRFQDEFLHGKRLRSPEAFHQETTP